MRKIPRRIIKRLAFPCLTYLWHDFIEKDLVSSPGEMQSINQEILQASGHTLLSRSEQSSAFNEAWSQGDGLPHYSSPKINQDNLASGLSSNFSYGLCICGRDIWVPNDIFIPFLFIFHLARDFVDWWWGDEEDCGNLSFQSVRNDRLYVFSVVLEWNMLARVSR